MHEHYVVGIVTERLREKRSNAARSKSPTLRGVWKLAARHVALWLAALLLAGLVVTTVNNTAWKLHWLPAVMGCGICSWPSEYD